MWSIDRAPVSGRWSWRNPGDGETPTAAAGAARGWYAFVVGGDPDAYVSGSFTGRRSDVKPWSEHASLSVRRGVVHTRTGGARLFLNVITMTRAERPRGAKEV